MKKIFVAISFLILAGPASAADRKVAQAEVVKYFTLGSYKAKIWTEGKDADHLEIYRDDTLVCSYISNQATFERFKSVKTLPFKGAPQTFVMGEWQRPYLDVVRIIDLSKPGGTCAFIKGFSAEILNLSFDDKTDRLIVHESGESIRCPSHSYITDNACTYKSSDVFSCTSETRADPGCSPSGK